MRVLAVIPARGNSKGIPRKNVRLLCGKPMIAYVIHNALACNRITDTVVSTDDDEIASVAACWGAEVLMRDPKLAEDATTLDPVIADAVARMEAQKNTAYDLVVTLQPTSPTLRAETLAGALDSFEASGADTLISVVNRPHLAWSKDPNGYFPLYENRVNRQQLPPQYQETGAFLITRRAFVTPGSRIGPRVSVFELPEDEAVDIDTKQDWIVSESILSKKTIVFRTDGHKALGMGHIYHCLTLAYHLTGHDLLFVTKEQYPEGLQKLQDRFMPVRTVPTDEAFFDLLADLQPDIVVNDCLDTQAAYMRRLKKLVPRVVTIEDLGPGARYADVVINALYEGRPSDPPHFYSGERYISLRDEFMTAAPKPFSARAGELAILFGGTDPSNNTQKAYRVAQRLHADFPDLRMTVIAGLGYDCEANGVVSRQELNITVVRDVKRISELLRQADLAITSQGRTVYELAVLGVPSIVLAQNEREQKHTFAQMKHGFLNLGLGCRVTEETLENTLRWLIGSPQIRREMRENMLRCRLLEGTQREIRLILGTY